MKKIIFLFTLTMIVSIISTSCKNSQSGNWKNERDSVLNVNNQQKMVLDDLTAALLEVSSSIDSIAMQEKTLMKPAGDGKALTKEQMLQNLAEFRKLLSAKQQQLNKLQTSLNSRNDQLAKLSRVVKYLNEEIEKKDALISKLETQLQQKNVDIDNLRAEMGTMSTTINSLEDKTLEQAQVIDQQATALSTVYYIIGTGKELKEKGVMKSGGLLSGKKVNYSAMDKQVFTQADMESLTDIPITGKSPKIMTGMPKDSYELVEESKSSYRLKITDPSKFWSISKYLIIQVK